MTRPFLPAPPPIICGTGSPRRPLCGGGGMTRPFLPAPPPILDTGTPVQPLAAVAA
ncbi:hypothetical protein [Amycolatopsis sp. NPDC006125]|uniref:hypothetical protein n=1 Tax=Amycolatopsis sp. NPDC006125 TaxID=3156730 RepID=UPI00339E36C5